MYDAAVVLHLLLLTYWLGTDLGVFYVSRFVLCPDLSSETRGITARASWVRWTSPHGSAWCCSCRAG